MKNDILEIIRKASSGSEAYFVGGWLRDSLIGRKNDDIDIAAVKNPMALAKKTAAALGGRVVVLDEKNKIYRVAIKNNPAIKYIDFASFKGKDIEADLAKRDFTVNAMARAVSSRGKELIDPLGGKKDLKKKLLKMTSPGVFKDDPLRLLRAFRIAAQLNLSIDPATLRAIKMNSGLIKKSAGERVRDELVKLLESPDAYDWVIKMDTAGLMGEIFPETAVMKKSARKFYFHPNGLWQHSMETLESFEEIVSGLKKIFPKSHKKITGHLSGQFSGGLSRLALLKIICLLHDVGKPGCAKRFGNKMRFLGHETKGARLLAGILSRLRFGRNEIKTASKLVESHMRPVSLGQAACLTPRAFYRLYRHMGNDTVDLALLSLSDCYSYRRLKTRKAVELKIMKALAEEIIDKYFSETEKPAAVKLIDGNDLLRSFDLKPGPIIGKLLKAVNEAHALGTLTDKAEALAFAKRRLTRLKK